FGYLRTGAPIGGAGTPEGPECLAVEEFVEKPSRSVAAEYLATGRYLWNAGMYLVRATRLREHLHRFAPELAAAIDELAAAWDTPERLGVLERVWPGLPAISIDHAISEPLSREGGVVVVPADLGWSDIGDWDAIAAGRSRPATGDTLAEAAPGPTVLGEPGSTARVHVHDSE